MMDFATFIMSLFIDDHNVLLATAAIMGGPHCITDIVSLLHDDEGLYDILRNDILTDPELSFFAGTYPPVTSHRLEHP